ncbi:hypothetical protein [Amycolatopsis deserti]
MGLVRRSGRTHSGHRRANAAS